MYLVYSEDNFSIGWTFQWKGLVKLESLPHNMVTIVEASKQASNQCINFAGILLTYTALLWSIPGVLNFVIYF